MNISKQTYLSPIQYKISNKSHEKSKKAKNDIQIKITSYFLKILFPYMLLLHHKHVLMCG